MTRRSLKPAAPPKPVFPRLRAAWRVLALPVALGPASVLADVTPPPTATKPAKTGGKVPCPPRLPGQEVAPYAPVPPVTPRRAKPRREEPPMVDGLMGSRPRGPDAPVFAQLTDGDDPADALVIHPHGPDEPCLRRG